MLDIMATIIKILLSFSLLLGLSACQKDNTVDTTIDQNTYRRLELDGVKYKFNSHLVSFLIIGTDTDDENVGHSDFMGLLIFDRENKEVDFLSLSRNAYVPIKTYDANGQFLDWSSNFLTLSYSYGDDVKSASYLTADAVSRLLNDIPMTYVASFDLDGIQAVHEVVETLTVTVPDNSLEFKYPQWTEGKEIELTVDNVEEFVRIRDVSEDFTNVNRMARQKTYLLAYVNKLKEILASDFNGAAGKLEGVLAESFTNFDLSEVEAFANMLMTYQWDENSFYELPGVEEKGMFHDKFIVDDDALLRLIADLFYIEK